MFCYNCMNDKGDSVICPYCRLDNSMEPAAHHLLPGTVLGGRYIVGYAIGEGGFGITYIGRDAKLDMRVAVKEYYPSGYAERSSLSGCEVSVPQGSRGDFFRKGRESFLREARNVAKFSEEPGIVDVRDYFEANGTAYIIMEYLDGMDLNRYLRDCGPMPARQAFELMLPMMRSLEKIHSAGIIHRDISPDNIMYLRDGSLKLMDFGSARYFINTETEMSVMLKQGYSPEEQYRKNGEQGPWTDVYGMCATIYRIVTGKAPVDGLDRMHNDTLVKPSELGVEISPALEAVLMYGMAVFRENRCQSMTELIALTRQALDRSTVNVGGAAVSDITAQRIADSGYRTAVERELGSGNSYGDDYTGGSTEEPTTDREKKKSPLIPIIIIVASALVLIAGAVTAFVLIRSSSGGSSSDTPTTAPTSAPTEAPTDAPTAVPRAEVANVIGQETEAAKAALKAQGFEVAVDYLKVDKEPDRVVDQYPKSGVLLAQGERVTIYIPEIKPTEAPTDPPTEPPTEDKTTYVNLGVSGAWFHKTPSRLSQCFDGGIPFGEEVEYLNITDGEFRKVRYGDTIGWVLSKYLVLKSKADGAAVIYDIEHNEPVTCLENTTLYDTPAFKTGVGISAGESAVQVGYCPGGGSGGKDCCEIYCKGRVYYITYVDLHDKFEYDNN